MSSENLAINGKTPIIRKKYTERKGPPFSAPDCQNEYKQGNDGLWYQSTKNNTKNNTIIWSWRKSPSYLSLLVDPNPNDLPLPTSRQIKTESMYTYRIVVLPKLLNCAYIDSNYTQLDRDDQIVVLKWFQTYVPLAVDTFRDILYNIEVQESEAKNGIVITITGPRVKSQIMEEMISEIVRDPDDDGNHPINFYYPGASDDIECLVTSDILSADYVSSSLPVLASVGKKKTIAEMRKECKECKDSGLLYDPVLKDSQLIKLCDLNPEVKKLYQETMTILEKLRLTIENFSRSVDPIGILTEYKTLLQPMV